MLLKHICLNNTFVWKQGLLSCTVATFEPFKKHFLQKAPNEKYSNFELPVPAAGREKEERVLLWVCSKYGYGEI